jgi:hypothetical protein
MTFISFCRRSRRIREWFTVQQDYMPETASREWRPEGVPTND